MSIWDTFAHDDVRATYPEASAGASDAFDIMFGSAVELGGDGRLPGDLVEGDMPEDLAVAAGGASAEASAALVAQPSTRGRKKGSTHQKLRAARVVRDACARVVSVRRMPLPNFHKDFQNFKCNSSNQVDPAEPPTAFSQ